MKKRKRKMAQTQYRAAWIPKVGKLSWLQRPNDGEWSHEVRRIPFRMTASGRIDIREAGASTDVVYVAPGSTGFSIDGDRFAGYVRDIRLKLA